MSTFVLLLLQELPGERRRDEYYGSFESELDARDYLLSYGLIKNPIVWRKLIPGTGPFESLCLAGKKPRSASRAEHTQRVEFAILEFGS